MNGFDAQAIYQQCYDAIPADTWAAGAEPALQPFSSDDVYTAPSDASKTAINVHFVGDSTNNALCYATGDPDSPTVVFEHMTD